MKGISATGPPTATTRASASDAKLRKRTEMLPKKVGDDGWRLAGGGWLVVRESPRVEHQPL